MRFGCTSLRQKADILANPDPDTQWARTARRPISLTSFLLKGLQKLVERYLRDSPMAVLPMHPRQHAYQAGKSAESALHQLDGTIEKALDALGIFFGIERAFDNTPCNAVKTALEELKIHRTVKNWIVTLIQNRTVCVSNEHTHTLQ